MGVDMHGKVCKCGTMVMYPEYEKAEDIVCYACGVILISKDETQIQETNINNDTEHSER